MVPRVAHALTEAKLTLTQRKNDLPIEDPEDLPTLQYSAEFINLCTGVKTMPEPYASFK